MHRKLTVIFRLLDRGLVGGLLVLALGLLGFSSVHAGELIPSIGLTRSVHGTSDQAKAYYGIAFREQIAPLLKSEIGVAYRSEKPLGNDLEVRTWPVTASLWLNPLPTVYAGGGVGWYHTTYDYNQTALPAVQDVTHQDFGVHLGGGLEIPLGPAAVDLNGRYVFLKKQDSALPPYQYDPDFWTTTLGVAFKF